jgi:hypothetical protein
VTFNALPSNSDTPIAVMAYAVDRDSTGTGTSAAVSRIVDSGGTSVSPDLRTSADDPGATITVRKKMLTAPGGSWDRTEVDGLRFRAGFGDGAPDVHFSSVMLEVAMLTASGATPKIPHVAMARRRYP